jgi:hypothetical protein
MLPTGEEGEEGCGLGEPKGLDLDPQPQTHDVKNVEKISKRGSDRGKVRRGDQETSRCFVTQTQLSAAFPSFFVVEVAPPFVTCSCRPASSSCL